MSVLMSYLIYYAYYISWLLIIFVLIPVTLYQYYMMIRVYNHLRKKQPDLIGYLYGSDIKLHKKVVNIRVLRWLFTENNETDSELMKLKKTLKRNQIILYLMIIPFVTIMLIAFIYTGL
jgi:hypothetical protein